MKRHLPAAGEVARYGGGVLGWVLAVVTGGWMDDDDHGVWILWNGFREWRRVGECVGDVVFEKGGEGSESV